ncbi:MAG: UDP-N-acetylmuramoyl-L-alanine--D-glutamate ligase [Wolbachia endosymbiont of Menacanthus eurysternus]|nr:MAG: UDP-N-acetylmuramoyl-L-alanine--D-glutamate ligase [Wolbachia endosymbiont of Menacanthus eurysternus]
MQLNKYKNQNIAVFGLGKTGLSVINVLINSGARVYVWDDSIEKIISFKKIYRMCSFIHPGRYYWSEMRMLVLSPGIRVSYPEHWIVKLAKSYGCKIKSDIELFFEVKTVNQKVIGVTGTNGKSTTVSLIGHILKSAGKKVAIGGNLGIPVLDLEEDVEIYIIEFSSFQLELIDKVNVDIAILLNITLDHIDRHGSVENYIATKLKLIKGSKIAVIGCDSEITANIFNKFTGNKISISASMLYSLLFQCSKAEIQLYHVCDIKINLVSNAENIVAAYIVLYKLFKIDNVIIVNGIKSFQGLRHRNEMLGKIKNVFFVNDSKATNVESTKKAILSYKNIYWILGGRSKRGGNIGSLCSKYFTRIKKAFLIGESTKIFASIMKRNRIDYVRCFNLENAFRIAFKEAIRSKEEIFILFSPACSSFDQWKSFEERGNAFCNAFENLKRDYNNIRIV